MFPWKNKPKPVLGIDIGRVIIHGDGPDTSFVGAGSDEEALEAPAMAGAFEAITRLVSLFEGRVWIVSKCGKKVENRSRLWLRHHRFHARTGIAESQLRFCRDRKEKAPIALALGIGYFIDDRIDVLRAMEGIVPRRYLFGASQSPDPHIEAAPTWAVTETLVSEVVCAV